MPLVIKRRHDSPNWYIRGTVCGKEIDETTGVADKAQAEQIRAKREWELVSRKLGGGRAASTWIDAALSYIENGGERRFEKPLTDYFGVTPLSEIGQAEVEACARKLYPGLKPASVNRLVFTPVCAILTHAARRKLCDKPTFERPKQPKGRVRWLTYKESEVLIAACSPHIAPLVEFMLYTGCRIGEALELDWREVDLNRAHVSFLDTKNGKDRGVPLHPRAFAAIANIHGRSGKVFRRPDGEPYEPKDGEGGQIKTAFRGACRRAGIENFTPHCCRHTWATWYYIATGDLAGLMRLGGWETPTMVMSYTHVNASDLAPNVMKLGENPGTWEGWNRQTPRKQGDST